MRSETSTPTLPNSPWIRRAPQSGFAAAIWLTNLRMAVPVRGRPARLCAERRVHRRRSHSRCHRTTVPGWTSTSGLRQCCHDLANTIQNSRSHVRRCGRLRVSRRGVAVGARGSRRPVGDVGGRPTPARGRGQRSSPARANSVAPRARFTLTALTLLVPGIGSTTAILTIAHAVLVREQLGDLAPAKPLGRGSLHRPFPDGRGAAATRTTGAALVMVEGEIGEGSSSRFRWCPPRSTRNERFVAAFSATGSTSAGTCSKSREACACPLAEVQFQPGVLRPLVGVLLGRARRVRHAGPYRAYEIQHPLRMPRTATVRAVLPRRTGCAGRPHPSFPSVPFVSSRVEWPVAVRSCRPLMSRARPIAALQP